MTNTTELLRQAREALELGADWASEYANQMRSHNISDRAREDAKTMLTALAAIDAHLKQPSATSGEPTPIDMVLLCPACGLQHIDRPEADGKWTTPMPGAWTNPPHRSHLCHGCGHIWRPADVPTNGVTAVKTKGKDDSSAAAQAAPAPPPVATQDERPTRADFVRVARNFAFGYGLQDDAPSYLPRTSEARDVFEPHAWVIALAMQAYRDGKGDGRAQAAPAPQPSGEPATMDAHRLYLDLCDLCSEVNAADTVIGRPQLAAQKLIVMRDAVGRAANGRLPYGAALSGELADIERLLGQFARACAFGDGTEARRAAGDAILRAFAAAQDKSRHDLNWKMLADMEAKSDERAARREMRNAKHGLTDEEIDAIFEQFAGYNAFQVQYLTAYKEGFRTIARTLEGRSAGLRRYAQWVIDAYNGGRTDYLQRSIQKLDHALSDTAPQATAQPLTVRQIADITAPWAFVRSDHSIGIVQAAERACAAAWGVTLANTTTPKA